MADHTVTLAGTGQTFTVREGQTILAAAERAGIPLLAGCHQGACLTCAARLKAGRVHVPTGTGLTERMIAANVLLPCVTTVSADTVIEVGHDGRTLLHPKHLKGWTD